MVSCKYFINVVLYLKMFHLLLLLIIIICTVHGNANESQDRDLSGQTGVTGISKGRVRVAIAVLYNAFAFPSDLIIDYVNVT